MQLYGFPIFYKIEWQKETAINSLKNFEIY